MSVVLGKLAISILGVIVILLLLRKQASISAWLENKNWKQVLIISWVGTRLLPFLVIYIFAGSEPTSDVNGFWDEASKASWGQIVYKDFWSPYSPLYPYFLGLWLKFWYSSKMIVLTMVAMDGIALWLSWHFFRPFLATGRLLLLSIIYLLLPGSLVLSVVAAQEDVWMWLFVVAAYLVREKTLKVTLYSCVLAVGLLMTKAIFVLILVPLFLLEKEKIRFLIPMILIGAFSLASLYWLVGWEFLQPLDESQTLRAPNIPSVINPIFNNQIGVGEKLWNWIGLFSAVGLGLLAAWKQRALDFRLMISRVWVVMYATMMIVQQSAYSNYIFLFLLPLVLVVIDWKSWTQIILLLIFNTLCVIHPSYWWRLNMPCYLSTNDIVSSSELLIDYLMQVTIVVLTMYFIWLAFPKKRPTNV